MKYAGRGDLYNQNCFLLESNLLTMADKEFFNSVRMDMPEVVATICLQRLMNTDLAGKKRRSRDGMMVLFSERMRIFGREWRQNMNCNLQILR